MLIVSSSIIIIIIVYNLITLKFEHLQFHAAGACLLERFAKQILVTPLGFSRKISTTSFFFILVIHPLTPREVG